MKIRAFLIFLSLIGSSCTRHYVPQSGDLLFQDLDCGELCDAIEKVTHGAEGANLSHVGIVSVENDTAFVYEAIGSGVRKTLLEKFFDRSRDTLGNPKVLAGRIVKKHDYVIPAAIQYCRNTLNQPYDHIFDLENNQYYCSELVYFAFKDSAGQHLFDVTPMTFKDQETGEIFPAWEKYYKELNTPIPEGKPGLNPGGISRSDNVNIVHRFYEP